MVSLANEVRSFHEEKKRDVSAFSKSPIIGGLTQEPSLYDILSYSYCYVGIMTGKNEEMSFMYNVGFIHFKFAQIILFCVLALNCVYVAISVKFSFA